MSPFHCLRCRVCGCRDDSRKGQTRSGQGVGLAQPHGLGSHTDVKHLHAHVDLNPSLPQTVFIVFAPKPVPPPVVLLSTHGTAIHPVRNAVAPDTHFSTLTSHHYIAAILCSKVKISLESSILPSSLLHHSLSALRLSPGRLQWPFALLPPIPGPVAN